MLFNVKTAYQDILQIIKKVDPSNIKITIIGHSRGLQAFMLANKLYNYKKPKCRH